MMNNIGCLIIAFLLGYIIFALVVFPLIVMFIFALPLLLPYIVGIGLFYLLWKYTNEKGDRGDRG